MTPHVEVTNEIPDYHNFLRLCYLVGVKTAPNALPHILDGVNCNWVRGWARDVRSVVCRSRVLRGNKMKAQNG